MKINLYVLALLFGVARLEVREADGSFLKGPLPPPIHLEAP